MQQQGVMPNVITYSALISACEKVETRRCTSSRCGDSHTCRAQEPRCPTNFISASEKGKQPAMPDVITYNA